ncbi:MAG: TrmH family RNA methyltransferase [Chloroflexi bacterium]|nr:TrmH family RNA methyltransferase [Chloroflexota bacterium]
MSIETLAPAGEQLEGQELYKRQKALRAGRLLLPGPTIVAAGLQVSENIGAVLRLADAVGTQQVIFVNEAEPDLTRIRRTARSTEALVRWERFATAEFLERVSSFQPLMALELTTTSVSIFETELPTMCTFVIGSEKHGIPAPLLRQCQQAVHIPMFGVNGSMNVTHALAVALFEWRRQHLE